MTADEAHAFQVVTAERDRAIAAGRSLVALIERVGGYMSGSDQTAFCVAKADLCDPVARRAWVNR